MLIMLVTTECTNHDNVRIKRIVLDLHDVITSCKCKTILLILTVSWFFFVHSVVTSIISTFSYL